jgi:hypothetical protein
LNISLLDASKYICTQEIPEITAIFIECFLDNRIYFGFPIFNTICFPRRQSVFLKVFWNKMRYNSDNLPRFIPFFLLKVDFLARKSFSIYKISFSRFMNVMQNRIAGLNMIRHRFLSQRNVFGSEVVPDVLAK